jgi:hypothetical protein
MLRAIVGATLALLLCAGIGLAADKEKEKTRSKTKGTQVQGKVLKVDTAKGALTITSRKKKQEPTQAEISLTDQTRVVTFDADQKKTAVVGKAGLSSIKEGDRVVVQLNAQGAAQRIVVNRPKPSKKPKS